MLIDSENTIYRICDVIKCEVQSQNSQRLAEAPLRCGILTMIDCFGLVIGYKSKRARIQQSVSKILKRRYTSPAQISDRLRPPTGGEHEPTYDMSSCDVIHPAAPGNRFYQS